MTVGISSANLATGWLNVLRGTNFTAPTGVYVKLHTADPGASGATAAAAGDTTRKQITWNAPSSGSMTMATIASSWTNGGTSETITHISFWDAATVGNFLGSAALTASQAWASGNTFALNSCTVSLTPIAA